MTGRWQFALVGVFAASLLMPASAVAYAPIPVAVISAPSLDGALARESQLLGQLVGQEWKEIAQIATMIEKAKETLQTANEIAALGRQALVIYDTLRQYDLEDLQRDSKTALYAALPELASLEDEWNLAMANAESIEAGPDAFFQHRDYHDEQMQDVLIKASKLAFRSTIYPVVFPDAMRYREHPTQSERLVQYHFESAGMAFRRAVEASAMAGMARKIKALVADAEDKDRVDLQLQAASAQAQHQTMNNSQFLRDAKEAEIAHDEAQKIHSKARKAIMDQVVEENVGDLFKVGTIK